MTAAHASPTGAFGPADRRLLDAIRLHDQGLRALLCTLARHGLALRRDDPRRAQAWLDALAPHPMFKGGQFLFDLLEWEDFMLDGEAPPVLDEAAACDGLARLAAAIRQVGIAIDPGRMAGSVAGRGPQAPRAELVLPPLEAGMHLFPHVVAGAIALLTRAEAG